MLMFVPMKLMLDRDVFPTQVFSSSLSFGWIFPHYFPTKLFFQINAVIFYMAKWLE